MLQFRVVRSYYSAEHHRLHFTATGERDGVRFTAATDVKCLKEPQTPENIHLVVLLRLEELFSRKRPSG